MLLLAMVGGAPGAFAQAPGPETFAKPPSTPIEYWDAADYLVRTGQARLAVPYLNAFLKGNPDDATLIAVRDKYGVGSALRLQDDPATRPLARPILELLNAAVLRNATDPARVSRFVGNLSKSPDERAYAVERLREAGPYAVPAIIEALSDPSISPENRANVVESLGKLDVTAVPPLIAALEAADPRIASDAAQALGTIRDPRAVAFLTFPAASPATSRSAAEAARLAIERITGRPFVSQPRSPIRTLTDAALRFHRHLVPFAADPAEVWLWEGERPVPHRVPRTVAESILGEKLARQALTLNPDDRATQVAMVSLMLEKAAERDGISTLVARDPSGAFAAAMASGPSVLGDVLKTATADAHGDLAAAACLALGRVVDRDALGAEQGATPLVAALANPDRRVQFAAASSLVTLNPTRPFPGSSQVVPTLARFVVSQAPRALVIDGNVMRANSVASVLSKIGYDPTVVETGGQGFSAAASSADFEVILMDPSQLLGTYNATATLVNLRADSRTAGIPVFLYGPLANRDRLASLLTDYPRVGFLVTPDDAGLTKRRIDRSLEEFGARPLSAAERNGFAQVAAAYLAQVGSQPNSPFAADLRRVQPSLSRAMAGSIAVAGASAAMGDVPGVEAQRNLASAFLESSRPAPLRIEAGRALVRSIQSFGPLVTNQQEAEFAHGLTTEADPAIRSLFASIMGALRPRGAQVGQRLLALPPPAAPEAPAPAPPPTPAAPGDAAKPEAEPKPATPAPEPKPDGDAKPDPGDRS